MFINNWILFLFCLRLGPHNSYFLTLLTAKRQNNSKLHKIKNYLDFLIS